MFSVEMLTESQVGREWEEFEVKETIILSLFIVLKPNDHTYFTLWYTLYRSYHEVHIVIGRIKKEGEFRVWWRLLIILYKKIL